MDRRERHLAHEGGQDMGHLKTVKDSTQIVSIKIDFYDQSRASITMDYPKEYDEVELLHFFLMYFAKILFENVHSEFATGLVLNVSDTILELLQSENIPQPPRNMKLFEDIKIVSASNNPARTYRAEFYEHAGGRLIQTSFALGEEETYIPRTVLVFLQHLLDNLSFYSLIYLLTALRFFLEFYTVSGDISTGQSMVNAVSYAIDNANRFLSEEM